MAVYQVKVKDTKQTLEVDSGKISDELCAYIFQKGLDAVLGRGRTKLGKPEDFRTVEEFETAAVEIAQKQVDDLYEGRTRMVGGAKAAKERKGARHTEALRLAKEDTRSQIRAAGLKISRYSAKQITEAATAMFNADPDKYLAAADSNLARAAQAASIPAKVDIKSILGAESPAKVRAAEAKTKPKAEPKAPIPQKGSKPAHARQ